MAVEDVVPDELRQKQAEEGFTTFSPASLAGLLRCLRTVRSSGTGGDYFEFGLFRGYTFWFSQRAADALGLQTMRFWGFDSFAGLPEVVGVDACTDEFKQGDYACSLETVTANLDRWGYDAARSRLVPGYFDRLPATAAQHAPEAGKVALALIDCDLYSSTAPVLGYLADRLQAGSILLFDDWNCYGGDDDKGERLAFREFLGAHPEWIADDLLDVGWHGHAVRLRTNGDG